MVGSGYCRHDGEPSRPEEQGAGPRPPGPPEPPSADGRVADAWCRAEVRHTSQAASGAVTNTSVIVEATHGRATVGHQVSPPAASVPIRRLRHPPPPPPQRGPDGRLALQLSAGAIEAARVNAPLPMPAYPRLDVGDAGYVDTLLQWLHEGRLSARKPEAVDGGVASKLASMQQ
eukprot:TRINITY_DN684_c0_g1_i1.p2 TRINITY_DN684_c0_g1~~TRINITY_DN684_c0_g1_i1.p2  ORF type:complete len:202 (-),score=8.19 TRINITY_DN684_c0_g1_i1:596-1117(-)